jgi:DNA-binding transcriptional regulator GbsR (MarR family)
MPDLDKSRKEFIDHWGSMATCWGINPAMGQVHALLYITGRPMNAEEIMKALGLSRAAVSMNLRDLVNWGIVRRVHRMGERKEYFESENDVWDMFTTIIRERKRREVDPTISALERCLELLGPAGDDRTDEARDHRRRVTGILEFLRTLDRVFRFFESIGREQVKELVETGLALGALGTPPAPAPAASTSSPTPEKPAPTTPPPGSN